jgi:hypothetical protein
MSSTARRHNLNKDQRKAWKAERDRRNAPWAQRKAKSKTYCASTR